LAGNIFFDKEVLLKRLEQLAKRPRGGDNHHSL
jgi:hypothetical protein